MLLLLTLVRMSTIVERPEFGIIDRPDDDIVQRPVNSDMEPDGIVQRPDAANVGVP